MKFIESSSKDILEGRIFKVLTILSIPIMMNLLIQTFYNIVSSYFMGLIGKEALAASAFTSPIFQALLSFGAGISIGGMIIFSRNEGVGKEIENKKARSQLILLSFFLAGVCMILGFTFSEKILKLCGATGQILVLSDQFMNIIYWGIPSFFIINGYAAIENSKGKTIKPMLLVFASTILNIFFAQICLKLGLGIRGIAFATVLASSILAAYSLYVLFKSDDISLKYFKFDKVITMEIFKLGLPVALSNAIVNGGFVVMNKYIFDYGTDVLAAYGIGNRLNNIFYTPCTAISSAISIMVSQNLAAKNFLRVKQVLRQGMILSCGFGAIGTFVLVYFIKGMTFIFTKDPVIIAHTENFMFVFGGGGTLIWAIFQTYMGYFQGFGHTKMNFYMNVGRVWLFRVPFIVLIEKIFSAGAYSIWFSMLISNVIIVAVTWYVYEKNRDTDLIREGYKGERI
ncbi:MAG: MATE family efflux transporter [Fusobacteriaceae bacterium]